jgi:hypothetical protein
VVPLHFWDVTEERPERRFAGCLHAHRTSSQPPLNAPRPERTMFESMRPRRRNPDLQEL